MLSGNEKTNEVIDILNGLKSQPATELSDEIQNHLAAIQEKCRKEFYNRYTLGNAVINRRILLDSDIAFDLTPDVIRYICTHELIVPSDLPEHISLFDVLYYGLEDLIVLKYMDNQSPFLESNNAHQKANFITYTSRIVANIYKAANLPFFSKDFENQNIIDNSFTGLSTIFADIYRRVRSLKEKGQSNELLRLETYYNPLDREDTGSGMVRSNMNSSFRKLCQELEIEFSGPIMDFKITLDQFCECILKKPEQVLDNKIIDRVYIFAALEQDIHLYFMGQECTYYDIFKLMVDKITADPRYYLPYMSEQMYLRLILANNDLIKRFGQNLDKCPTQHQPPVPIEPVQETKLLIRPDQQYPQKKISGSPLIMFPAKEKGQLKSMATDLINYIESTYQVKVAPEIFL